LEAEDTPEAKKPKLQDFFKWYLHIDFKDLTNYIAFVMAVFLLWWGIKTIMHSLSIAAP
jgi:hypothetical protein